MKREGNLYEKIISVENLTLADYNAQKGKKKQFGVIKHNRNREKNILKLHEVLKLRKYKTSPYQNFFIYEPKQREISRLSYYPNRIVHHAIMQYLELIFVKCFIAQTYSCIKKRGIHKCLKDVTEALKDRKGTVYCLKIDIRKFYPSIDKEVLKCKLRSKLKDQDLLKLLDEIIDSHETGLPLGNYLSQWFANFYLNGFDHWLKETKKVTYFRYCDDFVILHSDKAFLHSLRKEIQEYLHRWLNLTLSKYQVFNVEKQGIDFVGYKTYHDYILLRKSIKLNWIKMLRKNYNKKSIASYNGWLLYCNSINLQRKYLS